MQKLRNVDTSKHKTKDYQSQRIKKDDNIIYIQNIIYH